MVLIAIRRVNGDVTHTWTTVLSSEPKNGSPTLVPKNFGALYFRDEYESVDTLHLAARSTPNEVKAYELFQYFQGISIPRCLSIYATVTPQQDVRTVYLLVLEVLVGKGLQNLFEMGDRDDSVLADYLCEDHHEAIFTAMFQLALNFASRRVYHAD